MCEQDLNSESLLSDKKLKTSNSQMKFLKEENSKTEAREMQCNIKSKERFYFSSTTDKLKLKSV